MSAHINISLPPKHKYELEHHNSDRGEGATGSHRELVDVIRNYPNKVNWSHEFDSEQECYRRPDSIPEFKSYLITSLPHESGRIELMCRILESDVNYHIGMWV